ncbi:MAG TPA: hypothetical protein VH280_02850 [Verrucomicrobiae bacterium]|jgi:hypothetical protein|nr:hypothetical protein [Verrucomicrobiae bacterium]
MRYIIPILIAAIALGGCNVPSTVHTQTAAPTVAAPIPFCPMLITTLGTYPSPDGCWRIEVSEDAINFARPASGGGGLGFTPNSHGWKTQAGWFVFAENESRAWAYDGGSRLYLVSFSPSGCGLSYGIFRGANFDCNFPCAMPPEVISHLPELKKKEIQKK